MMQQLFEMISPQGHKPTKSSEAISKYSTDRDMQGEGTVNMNHAMSPHKQLTSTAGLSCHANHIQDSRLSYVYQMSEHTNARTTTTMRQCAPRSPRPDTSAAQHQRRKSLPAVSLEKRTHATAALRSVRRDPKDVNPRPTYGSPSPVTPTSALSK